MAGAESLTIMFVDMAGYSERTSRQSRVQNKVLLRNFNGLLVPLIARFGGRRVKSIGDALLVAFRSPTDSVRCAMAMHDAVENWNLVHGAADPIQIRVALNAGEVRLENDDIFGEAVNVAARVEELTPPGEIYLTGVVYLSMNKAEVPSEHIGEHRLKGMPEPVRLFRVPSHRITRLKTEGEALPQGEGTLPYGGMHMLPADSDVFLRMSDAIRRAPYVDWNEKLKGTPSRGLIAGIIVVVLGVILAIQGSRMAKAPAAVAATAATTAALPPAPKAVSEEARRALIAANTAFFERRRQEAAAGYAKVLAMEPELRHDSGLAANLVGTLGRAGELPVQTIRKYPSAEITFELSRRTSQPGRNGAQRAAGLLTELGQAGRIDQGALAVTDLTEAPTCEERLAALKRVRALHETRALPILRDTVRFNLTSLFRKDRNQCLQDEAKATIAELEKGAEPATPPS
jgi:class 3 adenylate cyclase